MRPMTQADLLRLLDTLDRRRSTEPVDLRPFVALERDVGEAKLRAAAKWRVQPEAVLR